MKKCTGCQKIKDLLDFHVKTKSPDGRNPRCKECRKLETKNYRENLSQERVESFKAYRREYYLKNKAKLNAKNRLTNAEYRKRNPQAHNEYAKNNRTKINQIQQKRRAITRGVMAESVDNELVFERDGWICQLCFEPVDPTLMWPDTMAKSLDHIVPVSLGGPHIYDNVQLAHFKCNAQKGNRT